MSEPRSKPFDISKRLVWEVYRKVAANKGAAGIDGESIQQFEADLKGNLYKLWNRLSSGSYFPPPVRAVEIPKKAGGTRFLGGANCGGSDCPNSGVCRTRRGSGRPRRRSRIRRW